MSTLLPFMAAAKLHLHTLLFTASSLFHSLRIAQYVVF